MTGRARSITLDARPDCIVGSFHAMGSPCQVLVETDDRREAAGLTGIAAEEAWRIEDRFSRYIDGNIVDRINRADGRVISVDDETSRLLDFAGQVYDLSGGLFDITSGILRRAWTFDGGDAIPDEETISALLPLVGWRKVLRDGPGVRMPPGMQIDFGGIGKEYAVDRAAALLQDAGELAALVNFGGDLAVVRPPTRRQAWKVGIESVDAASEAERLIDLRQGALATSGDARRFVQRDGVRYGHILDPRSGWPIRDAPRSVTVAADSCTQAGMLATLAMLEGAGAEQFLASQDVQWWCRR